MIHYENYWIYDELVKTGLKVIHTSEITKENWQLHCDSIFNIMLDTIELEETKHMFVRVVFDSTADKDYIELSLYDYFLNLVFWYMQVAVNKPILPQHFFAKKYITQTELKNYIDTHFIPQNRKTLDVIPMNQIIDTSMYNFVRIDAFSMFLANTMNMSDFLDLMERNPEVYDIMHSDFSDVPLVDVKKKGLESMKRFVDIVRDDPKHCLSYFIRAQEGLNIKQAKEVFVNIGSKPDGLGGVFPYQVNTSYFRGGVNSIIPFFIDASTSRFAQIIIKKNVGDSGHLSRLLGLNSLNTKLHEDKYYVCDTDPSNLLEIHIENLQMVNLMAGSYFRFHRYGPEYVIEKNDVSLIGKTIYKRSPMTCASAARGEGVCYRCYGDLAYSVRNINIGKIAAENLSAPITQKMLSAKHLIEIEIINMEWSDIFKDIFALDFNVIKLQEDKDYSNYKISIDMESIQSEYEDDDDDNKVGEIGISLNNYINEFKIITPDGEQYEVSTSNYDNIYFTPELELYLNSKQSQKKIVDDIFTDNLSNFIDMSMFIVKIQNNDLTKSIDRVKNILDKSSEIAKYDKSSILQAFIKTILECGLYIHSTHCEILLMNQMRRKDEILETPSWEYPNQDNYQILSLKQALYNNPSITITLMYQNIKKVLRDPISYRKTAPGITDLFFMKEPQEYLSDRFVEREQPKEEKRIPKLHYKNKK